MPLQFSQGPLTAYEWNACFDVVITLSTLQLALFKFKNLEKNYSLSDYNDTLVKMLCRKVVKWLI